MPTKDRYWKDPEKHKAFNRKHREYQRKYNNKIKDDPEYKRKELIWIKARKVPIGSNCEICGSIKNLIRHHEDYNKPLEIRTLCKTCHRKIHNP